MIGVHVCEYCGRLWETIGRYLDCAESHQNEPGYGEWLARLTVEQET